MGIKFGEIDANQILENEYRIGVLEAIVEKLANKQNVDDAVLAEIKSSVIAKLNEKYPKSGLKLKN